MVYPDDSHQLEANGNLSLVRYILLSEVSIVCLLAYLPKSIVWRLVAFVAVTNLNLGALKSRTGDVFTDYAIGCAIATRLVANSYLVFLADPLDNFQHEKDEVGPREMPFLRRIWWAFCIINGSRGVGWNYAVRYCRALAFRRALTDLRSCRFPKSLHAQQRAEKPLSFLVSGIASDISS
jgi:hypothetical protein